MASDPGLLSYVAQAPGLVARSVLEGQQAALQNRQAQQQLALQQVQLNAAQKQQQEEQQYQGDVANWIQKGAKPDGLLALTAKYPQRYQALKAGWDLKDQAQRTADLGYFGSIHAALDNNKPDLAIRQIEQRIAAEKQNGIDTSVDQDWLDALKSGDPGTMRMLKAAALAQIAAATGTGEFAKAYKAVGDQTGDFTLVPGAGRYDQSGKLIAERQFAPRPVTVGEGQTVVEYQPGGGDPASSGAGRYTGGWTPRERNGGDNSDVAVDAKISGMSTALNLSPTQDFGNLSNLQIAKALALSEGGPGSLADKNNNPANLTDSNGNLRKFPTKEAGLAAAAAQVARNRARGQNTIQSMVEGLPVQGGQSGGGSRVIAQGAPKQKDAPSGYQWKPDGTLTPIPGGPADPSVRSGAASQNRPIPQPVATHVQPQIDTRDTLDWAMGNFKPEYAGHTLLGDVSNTLQAYIGTGPKGQRDWWARIYNMDNIVRNQLFGSALTATEKAAWERTTVNPAMQPSEVVSNLQQRQRIVQAALSRQAKFLKANHYDPDAVDALLSPLDMGGDGSSRDNPIPVSTPQEAAQHSGKWVRLPDGRVGRAR